MGGIKRDITFLVISGIALAASLMHIRPAGIDRRGGDHPVRDSHYPGSGDRTCDSI